MKLLSVLSAFVLILISCAEHRDIDTLKDPDGKRLGKELFMGTPVEPTTWISKVTVVRTSANLGFAFAGLQSDAKVGHFEFTENKLKYLNDVGPYPRFSDATVATLINEWDITHHDVKLAESDGDITNKEEEDTEKGWRQKRQFTIDFANANISEAATFPYYVDAATDQQCWNKKTSYIVDNSLELSADYISFVVGVDYQQNSLCTESLRRWAMGDFVYTVHYRYSFKKLTDSDYKPHVYQGENDELMKKFGYFQTVREVINPETGLYHNLILMNRWHPEKEHDFFFTKDFPGEFKPILNDPKTGVFAKTNALFKKNGLKIRFHLHENVGVNGKVKEFGDIRYSFVNFVPEISTNAPFGYGPSDANPLTGELIAANLNMWTGYLKYYVSRVKQSFDREEMKFENSSLFASMKNTLKEPDHTKWVNSMDLTLGAGKALNDLLPNLTFGYPGWARFTTHETELEPLFTFPSQKKLGRFVSDDRAWKRINQAHAKAKGAIDSLHKEMHHRSTTIYPMGDVLANASALVLEGVTEEEVIETIVYRTAIHEFGHNLGLRHNFHGSVDEKNFRQPVVGVDGAGNRVLAEDGSPKLLETKTTSVMEYLSLEDEVFLEHNWEPYDEAALLYAYSYGKIEPPEEKNFLYCTDEHRPTNALCNHWDSGSTPSEVVMSLIKRYENSYFVVNYRNDRAYWDTRGYESRIFRSMWDIKRFLLLWRAAFNEDTIRRELEAQGDLHPADVEAYTKELTADLKQAVKLSIAFYNAVIQQSSADRPYNNEVEPFTGEKKRIGILYDKLYAMMFLMGDDAFLYNPNRPMSVASYLSYGGHPELTEIIDTVFENALTERVDMEPWFIGFARSLYAISASNVYNMDDVTLINKIKVVRFTPAELQEQFGITVAQDMDTEVVTLQNSNHAYFKRNEEVGLTRINDRYYMVSKFRNPYAFDVIQSILEAIRFGNSTVTAKTDLLDMYKLYQEARGEEIP